MDGLEVELPNSVATASFRFSLPCFFLLSEPETWFHFVPLGNCGSSLGPLGFTDKKGNFVSALSEFQVLT